MISIGNRPLNFFGNRPLRLGSPFPCGRPLTSLHHLFSTRAFPIVLAQDCMNNILYKEYEREIAENQRRRREQKEQVKVMEQRVLSALKGMNEQGNQNATVSWQTPLEESLPAVKNLINALKNAGYEVSYMGPSKSCKIDFIRGDGYSSDIKRSKIRIIFQGMCGFSPPI